MLIMDWSSDVCSSDLNPHLHEKRLHPSGAVFVPCVFGRIRCSPPSPYYRSPAQDSFSGVGDWDHSPAYPPRQMRLWPAERDHHRAKPRECGENLGISSRDGKSRETRTRSEEHTSELHH